MPDIHQTALGQGDEDGEVWVEAAMGQRLCMRAHDAMADQALSGSIPKKHHAALQGRRQARGVARVVRHRDNHGAQQLCRHALDFQSCFVPASV